MDKAKKALFIAAVALAAVAIANRTAMGKKLLGAA